MSSNLILVFSVTIFVFFTQLTLAEHQINFRSLNLYPEGLAYDRSAQHFLVGSLRSRSIHAVSDAGIIETLIPPDTSLPPNSTVLGIAVDSAYRRVLAVIHSLDHPFNALAAYDLRSKKQIFVAVFDGAGHVANDVAVDFDGNAYVTNSAGNFIWKVNFNGEPSVFSRSPLFSAHPVDPDESDRECGLNGIAYVSKGYLLVVQTNTGKMFKVDAEDGTARTVILTKELELADDIAVRKDGVVVVMSRRKMWFVKSDDSWSQGVVFDETALDGDRFPTSVAVAGEDRVYVLYGHVMEGIKGNGGREMFGIYEIQSEKENKEDNVWVFVIIGLALAYFMIWRFQMRHLVSSMDKKRS